MKNDIWLQPMSSLQAFDSRNERFGVVFLTDKKPHKREDRGLGVDV